LAYHTPAVKAIGIAAKHTLYDGLVTRLIPHIGIARHIVPGKQQPSRESINRFIGKMSQQPFFTCACKAKLPSGTSGRELLMERTSIFRKYGMNP
jgi:hypothetical protein